MKKLRVLIVDDERLSRQRLKRLLNQDAELQIIGECETGQKALDFLGAHAVDLMLLDVQMPELDGFGVLNILGEERMPSTIFVTAHDEYALRAFEVRALDYVLKPFDPRRLQEAVRRAKNYTPHDVATPNRDAAAVPDSSAKAAVYWDRMAVRSGENVLLLRTDQVDWIEAADNYVYLHCGSETHALRETMNVLERSLNPSRFMRIHRSAIVNLDRIRSLQPWFRGDYRVVLLNGVQLTLSRKYRPNLQQRVLKL